MRSRGCRSQWLIAGAILGAQSLASVNEEGEETGEENGDDFAGDEAAGVLVEQPREGSLFVAEDAGDERQNGDDEQGAEERRQRKKRVTRSRCVGHEWMMAGGAGGVKDVCRSGSLQGFHSIVRADTLRRPSNYGSSQPIDIAATGEGQRIGRFGEFHARTPIAVRLSA